MFPASFVRPMFTNGYSMRGVGFPGPEIHLAEQGLVCTNSVTSKTT